MIEIPPPTPPPQCVRVPSSPCLRERRVVIGIGALHQLVLVPLHHQITLISIEGGYLHVCVCVCAHVCACVTQTAELYYPQQVAAALRSGSAPGTRHTHFQNDTSGLTLTCTCTSSITPEDSDYIYQLKCTCTVGLIPRQLVGS